jgi:hypothetical protein
MKIPKQIQIAGKIYEIEYSEKSYWRIIISGG